MRLDRACALTLLLALGSERSLAASDLAARVRAHADAGEWSAVAALLPAPTGDPDLDHALGMALARLERWREAAAAFESGMRRAPSDKRFPLGLAGLAFKRGEPASAKPHLRRALALDPADAYANEFLAAVYFLEDNLEAALRYWNRAGKPRIEAIRIEPRPAVAPALLDRALACAPASKLDLADYRATRAALDQLAVFASARLDLDARSDGTFDLVVRPTERRGIAAGGLETIASIARGLPYRTLYADRFNLRGSAIHFTSLLRWDPASRRAAAALSSPLRGDPGKRLELRLDARQERWRAAEASDFVLRKVGAEVEFSALARNGWVWMTSAGLARRRFTDPPPESGAGALLSYRVGARGPILLLPERRFEARASSSFDVGRVLAGARGAYAQAGAGVEWSWLPRARGEHGRVSGLLRAGRSTEQTPFDALYDLGLDRDGDLALRGHAGTRGGRKGAGPRGRDFVFTRVDFDAATLRVGLVSIAAGPFVDAARMLRPLPGTPSSWLVDAGIQAKVKIAGTVGVILSYGRNLSQGGGAFFATSR